MASLACESTAPEIRIGLVGLDTFHVPTYLTWFNKRGTFCHTLNALLDAGADRLCGANRYEHSPDRVDIRASHYERLLHTKAG